MPLYNTVLYIPPIEPPRITDFDSSASHINDDRIKIAEVEACFGEFEAQLSKFCHCSQSNDVHTQCCVPGAGNFTHPMNERYLRRTVDEQLRDLTLEGERNRTRVDRDPQNSNFDRNSISILHRRGRFDSHRAQDSVTQSSSGIAEAESKLLSVIISILGNPPTDAHVRDVNIYVFRPTGPHSLNFFVRPLPPVKKRITLKTALKAFGLFCTFTGSGLLGYKLFVALPSYNGPTRDLQNKPIVITQPCSKISRELVYNLAKQGAHLILADDHWDRCDELKERLIRKYGMKSDMIECRRLELDSMISIRRFTASLLTDYSQLDTVIIQSPSCISNIISGKHCLTHDGFEKELGINYFATYLLSRLLINRLNENNGRLILVVDTKSANIDQENVMNPSEPSQITIPLDNINWDNDINYTPKNAYRRAQWFLLMFAEW
ncbi:unnamed protein product [Schistosoma haematobium]|nr:unnamed protein product [Schistosoma haematobium]